VLHVADDSRALTQLRERQDQLVEAFVYRRAIDEVTYKQQKDRLDQEIALAEIAAHDAKLDELDVEAVVVFAEHVLLNAGRLWQEFSLEQKQRLQQLLFPVGVTYADGEYRTLEMSPIFPHVARNRRRGAKAKCPQRCRVGTRSSTGYAS
jgi:hypothetical protein